MASSTNMNQQQMLSQFEQILESLVNAQSAVSRSAAEKKLNDCKSNFLLYLECLLQITLKSQNNDIRQLAIVMFRQSAQPNHTNREQWDKLPASAFAVFEKGLLTALCAEKDSKTYLLLCDAIGTLASRLIPKGFMQDIIQRILPLTKEVNSYHRRGFLRILDCLAEYAIDFLRPHFKDIHGLMQSALCDEKLAVDALKTFVSIVASTDNVQQLEGWKDLIPSCLKLLNASNEDTLRQIISSFIDLVSHRFMLIEPVLDQLLIAMVQIARNESFEFDSRKLAFEVLVVMSTNNAPLLRQKQNYMKNVVELALCFLSQYDEDTDFESMEDDSDQQFVHNARQWTQELAMKLGGGPFLSVAEPLLQSGIQSTNWKLQYASLQALCQIVPYIKEVEGWQLGADDSDDEDDGDDGEQKMDGMNGNHGNDQNQQRSVWDIVVPQILALTVTNSVRPPIKHSVFLLIQTLIVEHEERFQRRFHVLFYQSTIKVLQQWKNSSVRVVVQCLKCLCHFQQKGHLLLDHFKGVSDVMLKQLAVMVQHDDSKQEIKAHSVTAIGTSANVLSDHFLPYYDRMMPLMMNILTNNALDAMLRGKAMECIGMIGEAVGMRFAEDAHKLMRVLLPLRDQLLKSKGNTNNNNNGNQSGMSCDDSTAYNYINQLFARISRSLGQSFVQYFPAVIPQILNSAKLEAAQILLGDEATPSDGGFSTFTVHLRGIGDTKFCINAMSLDEKDVACHMLYQFAKDQSVGFLPYVLQTAHIMKDLMSYQYNARVRAAATTIVPLLLKSIIKGLDHESTLSALDNVEQQKKEWHGALAVLFEPFMQSLMTEPDVVEQVPILEVLGQICSVIGKSKGFWSLTDTQMSCIAEVLEAILTESQQRCKERIDDASGQKLIVDDQKRAEMEWANDVEQELTAHIIDVLEYTIKAAGEGFIAHFDEKGVAQAARSMLEKKKEYQTDSERLQAVCIFIDCMEYGGKSAANKYLNWLYPVLCSLTEDEDDDIKQTAVFGLGVLAKCGYLQTLDADYKWLSQLIAGVEEFKQREADLEDGRMVNGDEEEEEEEKQFARYLIFENQVSAIGKIIRYQPPPPNMEHFDNTKILREWIRWLPIEHDQEEFNSVTDTLLYFVERFWNELMVQSEEMRTRIIWCLLFYLSGFRDGLTSYEMIMDYALDSNDESPPNAPVLNKENIAKIKKLKANDFLIKAKAFENAMKRLEPQEIQNLSFVVNNY